jgi:hypothetical protein
MQTLGQSSHHPPAIIIRNTLSTGLSLALLQYSGRITLTAVRFEATGVTRRWYNDECELTLCYPGGHVAHLVYRGYLGDAFAATIVEIAELIVTDLAPVNLFSDITALTGNVPSLRKTVTLWTWANRQRFASYNVLMKPGLAGTTMAAISLRLSGFVNLWTNPVSFAKAIQQATLLAANIKEQAQ